MATRFPTGMRRGARALSLWALPLAFAYGQKKSDRPEVGSRSPGFSQRTRKAGRKTLKSIMGRRAPCSSSSAQRIGDPSARFSSSSWNKIAGYPEAAARRRRHQLRFKRARSRLRRPAAHNLSFSLTLSRRIIRASTSLMKASSRAPQFGVHASRIVVNYLFRGSTSQTACR